MRTSFAFGFSAVFHACLLITRPPAGLVPPKETLTTLEVSYFASPGTQAPPVPEVARPPAPKQIRPPTSLQPSVPTPNPAPKQPPSPVPVPVSPSIRPDVQDRPDVLLSPPHSGASSVPESEFIFIQHKKLIRDYLKSRLTYPSVWSQGTVHVRLVLRSDGALKEAVVLEASDSRLATVALGGVRSAAPYPPFPKELKESEARYDFLVQYRPD